MLVENPRIKDITVPKSSESYSAFENLLFVRHFTRFHFAFMYLTFLGKLANAAIERAN